MFLKDAVHPIGKADFFFGGGVRLRQNENQYPSERWPGGAILAARDGKTQIQWEISQGRPMSDPCELELLPARGEEVLNNAHRRASPKESPSPRHIQKANGCRTSLARSNG